MKNRILFTAFLLTAASLGCHAGPFAKRKSELCCPTDIRQTIKWSWGEDAVMQPPCGVSSDSFYGHKPTAWRDWPGDAAEWRGSHGVGGPDEVLFDQGENSVLPTHAGVVEEEIAPPNQLEDSQVPNELPLAPR